MTRRLVPTCDDVDRPALKALVHGAHLLVLALEVLYHGRSAAKHFADWWRRRG